MNKDSNKRKRLRQASLGVLSAAAVFASLGLVKPNIAHASVYQMHVTNGVNEDSKSGQKIINNDFKKNLTGYLQWNYTTTTKKHKGTSQRAGIAFGPKSSYWAENTSKGGYYKYSEYHKRASDAGKVGILYPDAFTYYDIKGNKKPQKLTMRLTWMGGTTGGQNTRILFNRHNPSVWIDGEGRDKFRVTFYSDKAGTKEVPIAVPLTIFDIDGSGRSAGGYWSPGQSLEITSPYYHWLYSKDTALHSIKSNMVGGDYGPWIKHQGTVYNTENRGAFTVHTKKSSHFDFIFGHEDQTVTKYPAFTNTFAPGKTVTNYHHPKTMIKNGYTDYFALSDNGDAQMSLYDIDAKKFVSDKPKGKFTKTNMTIDAKKPVYFDIRSRLRWPTTRFWPSHKDNKDYSAYPSKKGYMVITDKLDKSLAIDDIKVYTSYTPTGKLTNVTKKFNKAQIKNNKVTVTMKPEYAKASKKSTWGKYYHMVIKTHVKKGTKASYNKDGYGYRKIKNIGYVDGHSTPPVTMSERFTQTPSNIPKTGALKHVYFTTDKTDNAENPNGREFDMDTKHDFDPVHGSQWLCYELQFPIKQLQHDDKVRQKLQTLHVSDNLSPYLKDKIYKLEIGTSENDLEDHKFDLNGSSLNIILQKKGEDRALFKKLEGKNAKLVVKYQVRVRPDKGDLEIKDDDTRTVDNQATLEGSYHHKEWIKDGYYDRDSDGNITGWIDTSHWSDKTTKDLEKATTNKTKNPLATEPTPDVTKGDTDYHGASLIDPKRSVDDPDDTSTSNVSQDEGRVWTVSTSVGTLHEDVGSRYDTLILQDTAKTAEQFDPEGQWTDDKGTSYTGPQVLRVNSDGSMDNVSTEGDWIRTGKHVKWTAKRSYLDSMPLKGESYVLYVPGKVHYEDSYDKTISYANDEAEVITKHFQEPDSTKGETKTNWQVDITNPHTPTRFDKSITQVKDVQTGEVNSIAQGSTMQGHMNPKHDYIVSYKLHANLGTDKPLNGLNISDNLPENSTLDTNSIHVSGSSSWDTSGSNGRKLVARANGNTKSLANKDVDITFNVKVKANSDWSDYYNANGGKMMNPDNPNQIVTKNSYLTIPNVATLNNSSGELKSSSAVFNMGVQLFKTHQYIVQDDNKFNGSEKLDPSHYVNNTRNDKTAVTTAVKVQLPNYLKLDNLKANNNFANGNFDKGKTSWEKASDEVVRDPKGLDNLDLTSTTHNLPSNLQDASGKTYYYYTKWSPKTKFYRDYAALKNMTADFNGSATLSAHSLGQRRDDTSDGESRPLGLDKITNEEKKANQTQVHLSNIYSYRSLSDRAMQQEDGKKLDYRLYGQVEGLAVDAKHKTDFSKEGQPVKAWIQPQEGKFEGGIHTLSFKDGLGTGDKADVLEDWKNLNSNNLTDKKITTGYWSTSNTYQFKI